MEGSHVSTTSEIEGFKILVEQSTSAGIRRIEAITGNAATRYWQEVDWLSGTLVKLIQDNLDQLLSVNVNSDSLQKLQHILKSLSSLENFIDPLKELQNVLNLFSTIEHFQKMIDSLRMNSKTVDSLVSLTASSTAKKLQEIQSNLNFTLEKIQQKIVDLQTEFQSENKNILSELQAIQPFKKDDIFFYEQRLKDIPLAVIKEYIDIQKNTREKRVIFISNVIKSEKIIFLCGVSSALAEKLRAGNLVQIAARVCSGNGGGKAEFAQAGGKDISALKKAIFMVKEKVFAS